MAADSAPPGGEDPSSVRRGRTRLIGLRGIMTTMVDTRRAGADLQIVSTRASGEDRAV